MKIIKTHPPFIMKTLFKSNTHLHLGIKVVISAASMVLILPSVAIENPAGEELPKQKSVELQKGDLRNKPKGKKVAVLGVGGSPVCDSLAKHLGLKKGHGLTLFHISPDSAAEKVGLQIHDVITELNGRPIGCHQSLKNAVLSCNPGDQVTVSYIHQTERKEVKAELGARIMMFGNSIEPEADQQPFHGGLGHFPQVDRKLIELRMQKHMEQMKQKLEGHAGMELDLKGLLQDADLRGRQGIHDIMPQLKDLPEGENMSFNVTSSITHRDGQGSVTMKTMNGLKEIAVKDAQGEIVYEGPYQTPQDKAALPDNIRQRLDDMNLSGEEDPSFRLHIQGGEMKLAPADKLGNVE